MIGLVLEIQEKEEEQIYLPITKLKVYSFNFLSKWIYDVKAVGIHWHGKILWFTINWGIYGMIMELYYIFHFGPVWFDESKRKMCKWEMRIENIKV